MAAVCKKLNLINTIATFMEYLMCVKYCVECSTDIISFNTYSNPRDTATPLHILQMRKLKLREVKYLSTYK